MRYLAVELIGSGNFKQNTGKILLIFILFRVSETVLRLFITKSFKQCSNLSISEMISPGPLYSTVSGDN